MTPTVVEPVGFFWCSRVGDYHCVILDQSRVEPKPRQPRRKFCEEFRAPDPVALAAAVLEVGYVLPDNVGELCEQAPRSPRIRRGT